MASWIRWLAGSDGSEDVAQLRLENAELKEQLSIRAENTRLKDALARASEEKEALEAQLAATKRHHAEALEMISTLSKRVGSSEKVESDALAWFRVLDTDGDGQVTLDELLDGLHVSHMLTAAKGGVTIVSSRWDESFRQVNGLIEEKPDFAEAYRLKLILGTISDRYSDVFAAADGLLRLIPQDSQALLLKALYAKSLGQASGFQQCERSLRASSPTVHELLVSIVDKVQSYWEREISSDVPPSPDGNHNVAIVALGSPADDDGTPRPRLLGTLQATLKAARAYPQATIYVTGAAVSSSMPEAIVMRSWLCAQGIAKERVVMEMKALDTAGNFTKIVPMLRTDGIKHIVLVTVLYHLRRSCILADNVFESLHLPCQVLPMAGESDLTGDKLEARLVTERIASYRDLARAMHLYEKEDFEAHAKGICLLKWAR